MLDRRRLEEAHFKYAALRIASWYHQRSLLRPKFNDILEQFLPHYQKAFHKKYSGEHTNTHTHTMHIYTTPIGHRCHSEGCGTVLVLDGNQKNNQPVCATEEGGYVEYASLPGKVRTGCLNSPEQQSIFCSLHKPRQMKLQNNEHSKCEKSTQGVVESVLKKKETRNGTYYEVCTGS